ncbi:MAG: preprotein translocase subunit YajC [Actinobacteria bacterium]|nr:preprotein translocase subunit YajC [Actinomycetota bacterium]
MGQLVILVAMFALLWLLLIRPQAKRKLAQQQLLSSVEVGDEILTAGGLYGHVRAIGEADELEVEIAPGTRVRIARRAVAAVIPLEDETDEEPELLEGEVVEEPPASEPPVENR